MNTATIFPGDFMHKDIDDTMPKVVAGEERWQKSALQVRGHGFEPSDFESANGVQIIF
jgi:hypothetical protein